MYTAVEVVCLASDTFPSERDEVLFADATVLVPVPERATTRRVEDDVEELLLIFDAARAVVEPVLVPLRAVELTDVCGLADTRLVVPDADDGEVLVALRAADVVVVPRGTTFLEVVLFVVLVRVSTFIGALDCEGVVPGFRFVRIVLFIYGYKLL